MLPTAELSLTEFSPLTLLFIFYSLYLFVLHNLLDKHLNVKQASDMPAVQKPRHRIDPDAIPSPVSFLCAFSSASSSSLCLTAVTHSLLLLSFSSTPSKLAMVTVFKKCMLWSSCCVSQILLRRYLICF